MTTYPERSTKIEILTDCPIDPDENFSLEKGRVGVVFESREPGGWPGPEGLVAIFKDSSSADGILDILIPWSTALNQDVFGYSEPTPESEELLGRYNQYLATLEPGA